MNYSKLIQKSKIENYSENGTKQGYNGIYTMHKYWSKKPANLIRELILEYSKENELVLDPFCGSGVTIVESILTNRKAIGIDLNPSAISITKQLLTTLPIEKIENTFHEIAKSCENKINSFYRIKYHGKSYTGLHFLWNENTIKQIYFKNGKTHLSYIKPKKIDKKLSNSFSYNKIKYFYPKSKLIHNPRINVNSNLRVCDLFTPRNTHALAFLLNRINKIKDSRLRELFRFCFSASLGQSSKMVFVINRRGKMNNPRQRSTRNEIGSWVIGYWRPKEFFEINVWNCFKNRYKKIIRAKKAQFNNFINVNHAKNFSQLKEKSVLLINQSAEIALSKLPPNSVNYIILDPPHTDRIPYLELSKMWNDWLRNKPNYNQELKIRHICSNNDFVNYIVLLSKIIKEAERVLKPYRHLSLIFNSKDENSWEAIIDIFNKTKFNSPKISRIDYSLNSVVQINRLGGLKSDYVLTFRKQS